MSKINIKLRDPNEVMKLSRLGSFHQSKLSFLRSFIREFKNWEYKRSVFELDKDGFGVAVYSFEKNKRNYSLICFAQYINPNERSDRVIATKWDAAFVLHDGNPTREDINRLKENVPKQEIGRMSYKELTLSRANKSIRVFEHVVDWMRNGKWTRAKDYGEGSASDASFPKQPDWFKDARGFNNLELGLKKVGFKDTEVNDILGNNWYNFYRGISA